MLAEAQLPTSNVQFGEENETWRNIAAAELPAMPSLDETLATAESTEEAASHEAIPLSVASAVRRPFVFLEEQALQPAEEFVVFQDWEGVVETVGAETFHARLRDQTRNEGYASEIAELPIADVSADDRELLRPGAIFYLTLGRVTRASGRQERVGRLVFRRLPAWTPSTFRRAQQRAERLSQFLAPQN
jgi:hypothetical protein